VATSARPHGARSPGGCRKFPAERIYGRARAPANSGPAVLAAAVRFAADGDPVTVARAVRTRPSATAKRFRGAPAGRRAELAQRSSVVHPRSPTDAPPRPTFGYVGGGRRRRPAFHREAGRPRRRSSIRPRVSTSGTRGIFVFRPSRLLAEARRVAGDLVAGVERFVRTGDGRGLRGAAPDISIDFAVMEKISGVARRFPCAPDGATVGTWRLRARDQGTERRGRGNLVISPVPVLAPGMRDGPRSSSERRASLVLPFERESELKPSVEALRRRERPPGPRKD